MQAFGIAVLAKEPQGKIFLGKGGYVGCQIGVSGRPKTITLQIRAKGNGITPIAVYEMRPYEYPDHLAFNLVVPIEWAERDGIWIPHTRQGEKDFMDVILLDSKLHFRDVQISLLSRKGRFYIMAQLVYEGWIRTAADEEMHFVPSNPTFAYPGANYQATYKGRGGILATMARVVHEILQIMGDNLEEVAAAEWKPKKVPALKEWETGHVLFFCPITNTGHILGENGSRYHLWGNNLVNVEGPVHMLDAMAPVYFRPGNQGEDQPLPSIKSCKPA